MCPNTRSLKFDMPTRHGIPSHYTNLLYGRLEQIVSHFPRLRHLELQRGPHELIQANYVTTIIQHLPLLEHLKLSNVQQSGSVQSPDTLALHLSQLKFLSKLHLHSCHIFDKSWCQVAWPKIITDLALVGGTRIHLNMVQQLICCMAPDVIKLDILFNYARDPLNGGTQLPQISICTTRATIFEDSVRELWDWSPQLPTMFKSSTNHLHQYARE